MSLLKNQQGGAVYTKDVHKNIKLLKKISKLFSGPRISNKNKSEDIKLMFEGVARITLNFFRL